MKLPDEAPFVAIVVCACIVGAAVVMALSAAAGELCAHVAHFCR